MDNLTTSAWGYSHRFILTSSAAYLAFRVLRFSFVLWKRSRSPLRHLRGPKENPHWFFGHLPVMFDCAMNEVQERWVEEHGDTFVIKNLFGKYQLVSIDPRVNSHILFSTHIYQKSSLSLNSMERMLGRGVLVMEGERHRDQRRILNPSFGTAQIRDLTDIFLNKGAQLCEIWSKKCAQAGGSAELDVLRWTSKATLDIIGKAGFDYDFNTLNEDGEMNDLAAIFDGLFRQDITAFQQMLDITTDSFPFLRAIIPNPRARLTDLSKLKMDEVGMRMVQEKKAAVLADLGDDQRIDKDAIRGKDLISVLVRANLAKDLDPAKRLTDEEVLAQIPSFLVAGHETTSNTMTWAMYSLAQYPEIQNRLRAELTAVGTDTPNLDEINALPYLDHVVHEVLRLHVVLPFIQREAITDDVIPLSAPIVDRAGQEVTQIRIQKGDQVMVPIWLLNRSKSIWGPDGGEFNPDRWENLPEATSTLPGVSPNMMTFIGGPHSCIGFRFAFAELKSLLFHVVRGFEWKFSVPPEEMWCRTGLLMRPQRRDTNLVELRLLLTPIS